MEIKKKYIIIGLVIAITIMIVVIIVQTFSNRPPTSQVSNNNAQLTGTIPTLFPNDGTQRVGSSSSTLPIPSGAPRVVSTDPQDLQTDVPVSRSNLNIEFSLPVTQSDLVLHIVPDIDNAFVVSKNKLLIRFIEPLQQGTVYSYTVESASKGILYTGSFTTEGPVPTALPDTRPSGFFEAENAYYLENNPDVFLSNNLSYENQLFSMDYQLVTEPAESYEFTVTSKIADKERAKADAIRWMKSLGLNDSQITGLKITYN